MSRRRGFFALLFFIFLSHALSYGVEKFSGMAVSHYLGSSENPVRHLFKDGELRDGYIDAQEQSVLVSEVMVVVAKIKRYCVLLNVFLQAILFSIFFFILFRKRG